ncbi:MAG TPA: hypothetical protein VM406_13890 [Noviherbaspirillum sp.]|nr:hypothetical protein [Noviherbaspirillum sp.]
MKTYAFTMRRTTRGRERGAVLFLALIALITLMLAAAALTRSVDTNTVVAGNLAFRHAATAAADAGVERAIAWLEAENQANAARDAFEDADHGFNTDQPALGYYSAIDPARNLFAEATWANGSSACAAADGVGNTVCYIVERMCRNPGEVLSETHCLFTDAEIDTASKRVRDAGSAGAKTPGRIPLNRITVRVVGPRNTVSYVQAFVY